jgi:hypothetical protein
MRKFFLSTSFLSLILILLLVNSGNIVSISRGENSNNTTVLNNTNLDVSNLVYDVNSNPFNVSYSDWTEKWWQWSYAIPWATNPSYDDTGKYCGEIKALQFGFLL